MWSKLATTTKRRIRSIDWGRGLNRALTEFSRKLSRADESDFGDEPVLDYEVDVAQAVSVSRIIEKTLVALVLAVPCRCLRVRKVSRDSEVV